MLHIVYLRPDGMLLTKKEYRTWRDIQDEYDEYMASLGPWDVAEVIDFIRTEYPSSPPFTEDQIRRFVESDEIVLYAL